MPVSYVVVFPQPYDLEAGVQEHLVVVQPECFDVAAILLTVYDNAVHQGQALRFAILHGLQITFDEFLQHAD